MKFSIFVGSCFMLAGIVNPENDWFFLAVFMFMWAEIQSVKEKL